MNRLSPLRSFCLLVALTLVLAPIAGAQETSVGSAKWLVNGGNLKLYMDLANQLSKKQKILINSGFSTYTVLEIRRPESERNPEKVVFKAECTVNFDTWEETYDILRIDQNKRIDKAKGFKVFAQSCLTAILIDQVMLDFFAKSGGYFVANLRIDQISADRAKSIREWLIKQQSGVVKGLFSHMLGDIKVSEDVTIRIEVPPYAFLNGTQQENEVMALYPEDKDEAKR